MARAVPAHLPARARPLRGQEGLRRRRLRRLLGAGRRRAGALLRLPRLPRRGPRRHDGRRPRHARRPASGAAAVRRGGRIPVRLLHRGHDHHRVDADDRAARPTCRSSSRATCAAAPDTARSPTRSPVRSTPRSPGGAGRFASARPPGMRVVTGTEQYTMDHAADGLLHMAVLRSPLAARPDRVDRHHCGRRIPGVRLVLTHRDSPPVAFSTARHESRARRSRRLLRPRRHRAVRRPAGRRRGRRHAGRRRKGLPRNRRRVRRAARRLRSGAWRARRARRWCTATRAPTPASPTSSRNLVAELHGGVGDVEAGLRAAEASGGAVVRGRWHDAARPARPPGDARLHRLARRGRAAW